VYPLFRRDFRDATSGIRFPPSGVFANARGFLFPNVTSRATARIDKVSNHHRGSNHRADESEG
jgi:hypothetical protein